MQTIMSTPDRHKQTVQQLIAHRYEQSSSYHAVLQNVAVVHMQTLPATPFQHHVSVIC